MKSVGLLGLLLVGDEVEIRISFLLHPVALEHGADLPDEQVGRSAVEHQMMHVDEQMHAGGVLTTSKR